MATRPVVLVVLDGWGINPRREHNAIELANLPRWRALLARYPHAAQDASGLAVGLRQGLMGNSEVGHMNMGAGRVVWQEITRIDRSIESGEFFRNAALLAAAKAKRLHLMGLISNGGVHSDESHYLALIDFARRQRADFRLHVFLDGRDTPRNTGAAFVEKLRGVPIATVMGRYWAMDRDKRWERTKRAHDAIVCGIGERRADPVAAVKESYAREEFDEFVQPYVFDAEGIRDGDAVVHFNFRADRTRQMTRALCEPDFKDFERCRAPKVHFTSMTQYHESWTYPTAFPPLSLKNNLGQILSDRKLRQFRTAETEKYAHVTYFFNGGSDAAFAGEERVLVPSPKVATYDLKPEMSALEVTDTVVKAIDSAAFDFVVVNFANPDMVGHTGDLKAAIRAVEAVDGCVGRVVDAVAKQKGATLITADHGNCEQMIDYDTGTPHTYHTTNPVPIVLASDAHVGAKLRDGAHRDVAPTILGLMGLSPPAEMEGTSLLS